MGAVGTILFFEGNSNENIEEWLAITNELLLFITGQKITGMQLPVYLEGTTKVWYEILSIKDRN
jgi:hypothetical protein